MKFKFTSKRKGRNGTHYQGVVLRSETGDKDQLVGYVWKSLVRADTWHWATPERFYAENFSPGLTSAEPTRQRAAEWAHRSREANRSFTDDLAQAEYEAKLKKTAPERRAAWSREQTRKILHS